MYLLVITGFAVLPIMMMKRGEPTISRKRALRLLGNHARWVAFLLKYFWPLHILNTTLCSSLLIGLLDWSGGWSPIAIYVDTSLLVVLTLFSGILGAMPSYVIVTEWRRSGA
jgi:hypothetical protein